MTNRISIIIPVYNQVEHTQKCLKKLFGNTDTDRFELTVVDNASTDDTPALLQSYGSSITVITNPVNMGFATACNQGARAVSSQYVLFLNNDTEVQPGWLEPLIETPDSDPEIGAVGSRLLYPDGRLQHAGVVVISQKDVCSLLPRHVFMGEDPLSVPVDHPMFFQALTAACLMFRKSVFDDLGGFDEAYWNGCEDVDLCFKLHQAGKKMVYQPKSVVIHHESVSGQERLVAQPRNNARLRARWENVIQPDIIQDGWIARRGPSRAVMPVKAGGPDSIEYLEMAAAWWTKREVDVVMAKGVRQSRQEIDQIRAQISESQNRLKQTTEELDQIRREYARSKEAVSESQNRLKQTTEELDQIRREYARSKEAVSESQNRLKQTTTDLEKSRAYTGQLETRVADLSAGNLRKADLLRVLHSDFNKLLKSKRWQVGNAVIRFIEILMFRPRVMLAANHMQDVFNRERGPDGRTVAAEGIELKHLETIPMSLPAISKHTTAIPTDVVVCIHNALDDVKACLDSVVSHTADPCHLILVNDGSNVETTEYLRQFTRNHPSSRLLENETVQGYTRAANQGLRASTAEQVVLLNSDTIVPKLWLETLTECALSDPSIGIVGPMSNAASWQSVPRRFGPGGDWAVNDLPDGYTVDDMAELVYQMSDRWFPRVAFVNGFCFLVKRSVINAIGLLDEETFPAGYGEENDYCLRAAQAGFSLAIADHGYVYHAKSKSYSHDRRLELSRIGGQALEKKHGNRIIAVGTDVLRNQADLAELRRRIRDRFDGAGQTLIQKQINGLDQLDRLIPQMENDILSLRQSARWKVGNGVIRSLEIMLLRGIPSLAIDHMQKTLQETKEYVSRHRFSNISTEVIQQKIHQIENDLDNILASQRWKIGNTVVRALEMLLLRRKVPLAVDHLRQVLHQFNKVQDIAPTVVNRISGVTQKSLVDVVICVHNAMDDVRRCLESILRNTDLNQHRLILVDDGSDPTVHQYLNQFTERLSNNCLLIRHDLAQGYTRAANAGLKASSGSSVILLNSDTIVTIGWIDRLLECAESSATIGIVGPLSNAASFQSVPKVRNSSGDFIVNELPSDLSTDDMGRIVLSASIRSYPVVPFINGFCYLIKRSVIESIGYLDEENFPQGYGEENDYSIRASRAGFLHAVADHAYVYHAKSKSFGHETRRELSRSGQAALKAKYGAQTIADLIKCIESSKELQKVRNRINYLLSHKSGQETETYKEMSVENKKHLPLKHIKYSDDISYDRFIKEKNYPCISMEEIFITARMFVLVQGWENISDLLEPITNIKQWHYPVGATIITDRRDTSLFDAAERNGIEYIVVSAVDIPGSLNDILKNVDEDYVVFLTDSDILSPEAFGCLSEKVQAYPLSRQDRIGAVVFDEDHIKADGMRCDPIFKPGYSPDYLLEYDYVGNGVWLRRSAVLSLGGFENDFSQGFIRDMLLRMGETDWLVEKIDHVCCHRKQFGDRAIDLSEANRLIQQTAHRRQMKLERVDVYPYGPRPTYQTENVLASIIIPFRDKVSYLVGCLESIENLTGYPHYEILLINNRSAEPETIKYLDEVVKLPRVRLLDYDKPFNYSRLNNFAASQAAGDVLVFLNNDTRVISSRWLDELVGDALQPGVGAVGAKLYYHPNGDLQHCGVVVGLNGFAGHLLAGCAEVRSPKELVNYRRNCSAVTGACLAVRKTTFLKIGGFCEDFLISGNDVDLGLRLMQLGLRNIVNPEARLFHYEKATRKAIRVKAKDIHLSLRYYQPYLDSGDPYFNSCYSLNSNFPTRKTIGEVPSFEIQRDKFLKDHADQDEKRRNLISQKGAYRNVKKLSDDEVVVYDVEYSELMHNQKQILSFQRDIYIDSRRILWFVPFFDHIFRGGIHTIFRVADYFSQYAGTMNYVVCYGKQKIPNNDLVSQIRNAFPKIYFELLDMGEVKDYDKLPESDAAFCTLWNSAYHLVRYNKCKGKFNFLQDFEPSFYAAGSVAGLIEQTYRFGFYGVANTPGVARAYSQYNKWVDCFLPGIDHSVFYAEPAQSKSDKPLQIVFYGRPGKSRNGFRLGIEALRKVKAIYGNKVQIVSVGEDYNTADYGLNGVIENRGVLKSIEAVADLYRSSSIGLVFMFTAHPSYQPFEYMACGCVTVTNYNTYNTWFLRDGENCLLTEPLVSSVTEKIMEAIEDAELRQRVVAGGLASVGKLKWENSLKRIYDLVVRPRPLHVERNFSGMDDFYAS
jgi:GT2 family glycosyltransferase